MKKILPFVGAGALCACLMALPLGAIQDPSDEEGEPTLESRVEALEKELAAEREKNEEMRAILDETVSYLAERAKSSKEMMGTLDASEKAGFTAGINFQSREMLLKGFRDHWGAAQKDLPGQKKKAAKETENKTAQRRVPDRRG